MEARVLCLIPDVYSLVESAVRSSPYYEHIRREHDMDLFSENLAILPVQYWVRPLPPGEEPSVFMIPQNRSYTVRDSDGNISPWQSENCRLILNLLEDCRHDVVRPEARGRCV
jgi:hypothetical protein